MTKNIHLLCNTDRSALVEQKPTAEEVFRSSLEDVIAISEKLSPICESVDDLIGIAKLALDNAGQLRLLMQQMQKK